MLNTALYRSFCGLLRIIHPSVGYIPAHARSPKLCSSPTAHATSRVRTLRFHTRHRHRHRPLRTDSHGLHALRPVPPIPCGATETRHNLALHPNMSEVTAECEELGFVITGIRPATNSLDTNTTNTAPGTVNNATKFITPIPDFSFTDITPAITIDFPTTTPATTTATTPKSPLSSSPTSTDNSPSCNHLNSIYSLNPDTQFPLNPTGSKPSHFTTLSSSPTSDNDSNRGGGDDSDGDSDAEVDGDVLQSKNAKNPINIAHTSTSANRPRSGGVAALVEGYDSDTSGSSSEARTRVRVRKKKRRVRFCEKVSVYLIPNNTANKLREAQGEFEDLVDSMGSSHSVDTLDPLASLPPADPDLASDLAAFERDIAAVECTLEATQVDVEVEDLGLVDAEEVERFDDAVQRDLESRVARLRSKLKRKRDDVHDTPQPTPTSSSTLPDLLGTSSNPDTANPSNPDTADDVESDLLISLAKKPRLINCHM